MQHEFKTRAEQHRIKAKRNPMYAAHIALDDAELNDFDAELKRARDLNDRKNQLLMLEAINTLCGTRTDLQAQIKENDIKLNEQAERIANLLKG